MSYKSYIFGAGLLCAALLLSAFSGEHNTDVKHHDYAPSASVGSVDGVFVVGSMGSANYSIEIDVPPGTAGVAPELEILYDSMASNGYLGKGFSLRGVSSITRCSAISGYQTEQYKRYGVAFTQQDQFCLGGEPLVAVEGEYGTPNAVYRTQRETWTRVTPHGECGVGPCYFKALNKNGEEILFGQSEDARLPANGQSDGTVLTWSQNRFTDLNGNYVEVVYDTDKTTGEQRPSEIRYTGNDKTGLVPQRTVRFSYEARDDTLLNYIYGSSVSTIKRLKSITTLVNGEVVLAYNITYGYGKATGVSRIETLTKCDAKGVCLPPTRFNWSDQEIAQAYKSQGIATPLNFSSVPFIEAFGPQAIDINADGKQDFFTTLTALHGWANVTISGSAHGNYRSVLPYPLLSHGNGAFALEGTVPTHFKPPYPDMPPSQGNTVIPGDVKGNGVIDTIDLMYISGGLFAGVYENEVPGQGYVEDTDVIGYLIGSDLHAPFKAQFSADIIGQGHAAFTVLGEYNGQYMLASFVTPRDESTFPEPVKTNIAFEGTFESAFPVDANQDGKSDVAIISKHVSGNQAIYTFLSNGDGTFTHAATTELLGTQDKKALLAVNANQDDVPDIRVVSVSDNAYVLRTYWGLGNGAYSSEAVLEQSIEKSVLAYDLSDFTSADINGDTLSDMVATGVVGGKLQLAVFLGAPSNGYVRAPINIAVDQIAADPESSQQGVLYTADITGVGQDSLVYLFEDAESKIFTFNSFLYQGVRPDLLAEVHDGMNATTKVSYAPLTDENVYTESADEAVFPAQNFVRPLYVVSRYAACSGMGECDGVTASSDQVIYDYHYHSLLYDVQLGKLRGFERVKQIDHASGRYHLTTYLQDYPYLHQMSEQHTCAIEAVEGSAPCGDGAGALLYHKKMTYQDISEPLAKANGIYQVLPVRTESVYYEPGSSASAVRTAQTNAYDAYGNMILHANLGSIDEQGNPIASLSNNPLYSCALYYNDETSWRFGYVVEKKLVSSKPECEPFSPDAEAIWKPGIDLQWTKAEYDASMNLTQTHIYDATHESWLTTHSMYDDYGNVLGIVSPSGTPSTPQQEACTDNPTQSCFVYDDTYHSFVEAVIAPENAQGERVTSWLDFDVAFGNQTFATNPNAPNAGDEAYSIFTQYDGFGRVVSTMGPNPEGVSTSLATYEMRAGEKAGIVVQEHARIAWDKETLFNEQTLFDGFARDYLKIETALREDTPDNIVTRNYYSAEGQLSGSTLPYYASNNENNSLPENWEVINCTNESTNAKGWVKQEYDVIGRPTCVISPDGVRVKYVYGYAVQGEGNTAITLYKVTKTEAYGSEDPIITHNYFDSNRLLVRKEYPNGDALFYHYDALGRLLAITLNAAYNQDSCQKLAQDTRCFTYDSVGRVTEHRSLDTGVKTTRYASNGRVSEIENADGSKLVFAKYDNLDRVLERQLHNTDGSVQQTDQFVYDTYDGAQNAKGQLASVASMDVNGKLLYRYRFSYDAYAQSINKLVSLADGSEYVHAYSYTPQGAVATYSYPDGSVSTTHYRDDLSLHSLSLRDAAGANQDTVYAKYENYNVLGNAQHVTYQNAKGSAVLTLKKSFYTAEGGRDKNRFIGGSYMPASISVTAHSGGINNILLSENYEWNALEELYSITSTDNAETFGYNADAQNAHMGYLTDATGKYGTFSYQYDKTGNILSQTHQKEDVVSATTYDYRADTNQLVTVTSEKAVRHHSYDADGQLIEITQTPLSSSDTEAEGISKKFAYLPTGMTSEIEVVEPDATGHAPISMSEHFVYDAFNALLSHTVTQGDNRMITHYVAPGYEINHIENAQATREVHTKYMSDEDGVFVAISHDGKDAAEKVAAFTKQNAYPPSVLSISPDADKTLMSWLLRAFIGLAVLCAIWQFAKCVLSRRKTADKTPISHVWIPLLCAAILLTHSPATLAALHPGENGSGYPVAGSTRYFVKDIQGSVVFVTNEEGEKTATIPYLPYGGIDTERASGIDDFQPKFLQNPQNLSTGFYHFGERFFDPETGRFNTPDPAHQYLSPYLYAGDDPTSYVDLDGEFAFIIGAVIAFGVVGGFMGAASVNGSMNPLDWDFTSAKTYIAFVGSAAISAGMAYFGASYPVASIFISPIIGAGENAALTALGGGSLEDIGISAAMGLGLGLASEAAGYANRRLGGGASRRTSQRGGNEAANDPDTACYSSFAAGTMVKTKAGEKDIAAIEVGDVVYSVREATGDVELQPVRDTFSREVETVYTLTFEGSDEVIHVTNEHPFYTKKSNGYAWVEVQDLQVGEAVYALDKSTRLVSDIKQQNAPQRVFNMEVEHNHNYIVSALELLVKNCTKGAKGKKAKTAKGGKTPPSAAAGKKGKYASLFLNTTSLQKFKAAVKSGGTKVAKGIKSFLRGKGGKHEWLMVSRFKTIKKWMMVKANKFNVARYFKTFTSDVKNVTFVEIKTKKTSGHGGSSISSNAHLELGEVIDNSTTLQDFIKNVRDWADGLYFSNQEYKVLNGSKGLPSFN